MNGRAALVSPVEEELLDVLFKRGRVRVHAVQIRVVIVGEYLLGTMQEYDSPEQNLMGKISAWRPMTLMAHTIATCSTGDVTKKAFISRVSLKRGQQSRW